MNIQTKDLKSLETVSLSSFNVSDWFEEKAQMLDQIEMLEREVDRQETIIDALVKAINIIERG